MALRNLIAMYELLNMVLVSMGTLTALVTSTSHFKYMTCIFL